MPELLVAHTADLDLSVLDRARALLFDVFDDMEETDWEHSLGGVHAVVLDDEEVVAHGSVVQRRLLHGGRALRCGYVEGVGVRDGRRREGHGAAVMGALERVVRRAYDLGALGTTEEAADFYATRGWQQWRGLLHALTPDGTVRTEEEEGWVLVLPAAADVDLDGALTCDWRDGDVW